MVYDWFTIFVNRPQRPGKPGVSGTSARHFRCRAAQIWVEDDGDQASHAGAGPLVLRLARFERCEEVEEDLAAALGAGVDGILLAGVRSGADLQRLDALLSVLEVTGGRQRGETAIIAELGGDAAGLLAAATLSDKTTRLAGIVFDARALAAIMNPAGHVSTAMAAVSTARGLTLLAAVAAGVPAIAVLAEFDEPADCHAASAAALSEGFSAVVVSEVSHVDSALEAFSGDGTQGQTVGRIISKISPTSP